jgi:hypothetical protein
MTKIKAFRSIIDSLMLMTLLMLCLRGYAPSPVVAYGSSERVIYLPLMSGPHERTGLLEDFEGAEVGVSRWTPYAAGLTCTSVAPGYRSEHALRMDLAVPAGTYTGCGRAFDPTGWVTAEGLRLTWRSDTPGLAFSVALLLPDTFYASHFVTGGSDWTTVFLPWESFLQGDGSGTPFSEANVPLIRGINFDVGSGQVSQHGTIWIDDLRLAAVATNAHVYYVSPQGDDAWSGLLASPNADGTDGPFRTLARARDAVRARLGSPQTSDIVVFLREGTYRPAATLEFVAQDSGRDGYRVVYRNYPGEQPVVSGGEELTGWQHDHGNIYTTEVDWTFYTLYENDVRGVLARHPNQDLSNGRPSGNEYMQTAGQVPGREWDAFKFDPETFPVMQDTANLEIILWNGGPDGYFHWWTNTGPIANVFYADQTIELGFPLDPEHHSFMEIGSGTDYLIQNSLDLLDAPGEFYIQGTTLYYWPRSPGVPENVVAPRLTQIFRLLDWSEPVHNLAFEGLMVRDTDRDIDSWPGFESSAAFFVSTSEDIDLVGNHIFAVGGYGVQLQGDYVQRVNVESNLFHHVGKSAVVFNGYPGVNGVNDHRENVIANNQMYQLGEMIGHGSGLRMYNSSANHVIHNLIYEAPAAAIFITGGVGVPTTRQTVDNWIAFNDVHDVTLDFQDMGPIYISGAGPGNTVHNNHFHNTNIDYTFGYGIYLDEGPISTTVSANLVEKFQLPPEQEGYIFGLLSAGDIETVIENNIVAYNEVPYGGLVQPREYNPTGDGGPKVPDDTPPNDIDVRRNIFYNNHGPLYTFKYDDPVHRLRQADHNLFYNAEDLYLVRGLAAAGDLAAWQMLDDHKFDQHSLVADPLFVDAEVGDYRLRFDSLAYGLGFEDVNFVDIGLRADFPYADPNDPLAQLFVTSDVGGHGATLALSAGQQAHLTATARTETGYVADLSTATVTYASENAAVATVDAAGRVTAQGYGATRIIVTVTRGSAVLSLPVFVLVDIDPTTASGLLPPPVDPPAPVPAFLSSLFLSDYDDAFVAFKSNPYARWRIVEEGGDAIYCAPAQPGGSITGTFSMLGSPYWDDYAVSMWVRLGTAPEGSVALSTRFDSTGWSGYNHRLSFNGVSQDYCGYGTCEDWEGEARNIQPETWHHLRAEVDGGQVRTFLDGQLIAEQPARSTHRERGYVGLGIYPDVAVCVDDVVVRSLDRSPEAMAGAETRAVTQASSVYLRPQTQAPVVGSVAVGDTLFILAWSTDGTWAHVRDDVTARQGWIPANCVSSP